MLTVDKFDVDSARGHLASMQAAIKHAIAACDSFQADKQMPVPSVESLARSIQVLLSDLRSVERRSDAIRRNRKYNVSHVV